MHDPATSRSCIRFGRLVVVALEAAIGDELIQFRR